MIQILRKMMGSKIGVGLALTFLVVIALAFAAGDISNQAGNSGASGDKVATVGKQKVYSSQLSQAATNALEGLKRDNPGVTMQAFAAQGGIEKVLDQLLDRIAVSTFGRKHGVVASDRLIDSEIAKVPTFKGPDGNFSDAAFRQMLQQQGLSEKALRDDLSQGLITRQLTTPAEFAAVMPRALAVQYGALLREKRSGTIALLPSAAFAPTAPPSEPELQAFYTKHRDRFIRPERRSLRFALFGEAALKAVPPPTDAEIAARYNANIAQYSALETRRITQLIVPTEAAARAILAEVAAGKRLEPVATAKGLAAASLGAVSKGALASQSAPAVADASFAAASGTLAAPARSPLGWHVMRIDGIDKRPGRTLEQVKAELTAQIAIEKRRDALNDMSARIEEEFGNGGNLSDAAKALGLTLQVTPPLTADGKVYGDATKTAPPPLAKLIQTAFAMEREAQPQLAEVEPGKTFAIFDVNAITASAPAPLAEVRADVAVMLALERGAGGAKAAADTVLAAAKRGTDIAAAIAALGKPLPPVQRIAMGREQLTAAQQQVPPPLALLFSMARGTTKLLPAPDNRGWFVVSLSTINPGQVAPNDPVIAAAQRELGQIAGREYSEQLARAVSAELGVKREDAAIGALRTQLVGGN